ncbi:MAG TPA: hypothetical protein VK596_05500 [Edaphobacter sp.]|nr:hypothetical protein [Edaphobacter sp.]
MNTTIAAMTVVLGASIAISAGSLAQAMPPSGSQHGGTLSVKGYTGTAPLVQMNGRSYVDLEALARLIEGSLAYTQDHVTLTLPSAPAEAPSAEVKQGFSKPFLRAGIEEMAVIREWRTAIVNAVENNYPLSEGWVSTHRRLADTNLKLAATAASTDDDHSGVAVLTAEFKNMQKLSDWFLQQRQQATCIPADALDNNALNQQILACSQSMAAMASNNAFVDDANCHESQN